MPTYDYICAECGDRFENFQSMTSAALTRKPGCERDHCSVKRIISGGSGVIFKGSGFYQTDYKKNGKPEKTDTEKKDETETGKPKDDNNKTEKTNK